MGEDKEGSKSLSVWPALDFFELQANFTFHLHTLWSI